MASLNQNDPTDDYRKTIARALLLRGTDTSPIKHWTEGAARLAQALVGSMWGNQFQQENADANKWTSGLAGALMPPTAQVDATGRIGGNSSPSLNPAPMSATPAPMSGGTPSGPTLSPTLIGAVKKFEGFAPTGQPDYKQISSGYGTKAGFVGEPIDQATADQRLKAELGGAAQSVMAFAPNAPQGVKDALTSLTYNAGPGWMKAGLGQLVQAGDWQQVADRLQQYNKAGGQTLPGLVNRRAMEASWITGPQPTQPPGTPVLGAQPTQIAAGQSPIPAYITSGMNNPNPEIARRAKAMYDALVTKQLGQQPEYTRLNDEQILEKHSGRVSGAGVGYRPLVDPAERAQYGIPADDKRPYQLAPGNKLVNPPPENRVNIDQRAPNKFEETYGEGLAKEALAVNEAGIKAGQEINNIRLAKQVVSGMQSGKLTPAMGTIGAWAKAVGMKPESLGIDPTLPAKTETLDMLANQQLVSGLGPGGFPSQNFSDTDRKFMEKLQARPGDQPESAMLKLEAAERLKHLQIEKAREWAKARRSKTSFEDFQSDWNDKLATRDIFKGLSEKLDAIPSAAPAQPSIDDLVKKYGGQ